MISPDNIDKEETAEEWPPAPTMERITESFSHSDPGIIFDTKIEPLPQDDES